MLKKKALYILIVFLISALSLLVMYFSMSKSFPITNIMHKTSKYRIAIASNPIKTKTTVNSLAIKILQELSDEFEFEFIQIESGDNFEWVYSVGEIHEKKPLDLLVGVGWEASEFFPIIHSRYEDLQYVVLDNKVEFPYGKSVYFASYDCSYIIGAMMATAFPKEDVFGFISNFETGYTNAYLNGYKDGLRSVRPNILVSSVYTKNYDKASTAYELTKEQNEFGIKVLMSTLSTKANEGVYKYAKESEATDNPIYTTCLGTDETAESMSFILTGITENIELALRLVISDFIYHGFNLNEVKLELANNGADVLFASTQDVRYRNEKIITDEVIAAGTHALEFIEEKNAQIQLDKQIKVDKDNQVFIRGTLVKAR